MEAKGIVFNNEWHVETDKTVVLNNPNKDNLMHEASLRCSPTRKNYVSEGNENSLPPEQTGMVDSGETHLYIAPNAPYGQLDTPAKKIRVGTANGQVVESTAKATLPIPKLDADFLTTGYIMQCSSTVTFIKHTIIYNIKSFPSPIFLIPIWLT